MKMVVITAWIRRVCGGEKVKDYDVDEAHRKNEGVYSKGVGCMVKRMVCNFERLSRSPGYGDNRRGSSTARRMNRDQFKKIRRLRCSKNFISERDRKACTQYVQ